MSVAAVKLGSLTAPFLSFLSSFIFTQREDQDAGRRMWSEWKRKKPLNYNAVIGEREREREVQE